MPTLTADAFGVGVSIHSDDADVLRLIRAQLPEFPPAAGAGAPRIAYQIACNPARTRVAVLRGRRTVAVAPDSRSAASHLVNDLQAELGCHADGYTFVHAGVVGIDGEAVLLPARSGAGKSSLVTALLQHGAAYGSDEFAVISREAVVFPYSRSIALRSAVPGLAPARDPADGPRLDSRGVRIGAIIFTEFVAGSGFDPQPVSPARAALGLLQHALGTRRRPIQTMTTLHAVVLAARAWAGVRGEADATARAIIHHARAGWPPAASDAPATRAGLAT